MSEDLTDLKIKLEFMQNNISEMNLYLEEAKQTKSHKISPKVFDLHKETTDCAKEVSQQLKHLSTGTDLKEMKTQRKLMTEFLAILSDLNSLQKLIIEKSVINYDCVDCGTKLNIQTPNSLLSHSNQTYLWLSAGFAVMGAFALYKHFGTE